MHTTTSNKLNYNHPRCITSASIAAITSTSASRPAPAQRTGVAAVASVAGAQAAVQVSSEMPRGARRSSCKGGEGLSSARVMMHIK